MPSIQLRPVQPDDMAFLREVYASTRLEELAVTGWSAAQVDAFVGMQFEAQHRQYLTYPAASFQIILKDGHPVGRLYVARWEDEIRLMDITVLPAHRGAGIGTSILTDLLAEAERTGKTVCIHVEPGNPALRLYTRLGFRLIGERGVYGLLEWSPPSSGQLNTAS